MPIYKPSELKNFLNQLGIHPKKSLSQNFLIDGNIVHKIIELANLSENDVVLEIGPGPGCLTEAMLERKAKIIAVDKDTILSEQLQRFDPSGQLLTIYNEDIMQFDLEKHFFPLLNGAKGKVIANLPYHLTTPIIANLVTQFDHFSDLILMVQEEVARRFVAKPNTPDYSSFTIFLNAYCDPLYAFKVKKGSFFPEPKVDSAIVHLKLKALPNFSEKVFELTRRSFEQRRKMLKSSLKDLYPSEKIEEGLKTIGKNPLSRPENLSLQEFVNLYNYLDQLPLNK